MALPHTSLPGSLRAPAQPMLNATTAFRIAESRCAGPRVRWQNVRRQAYKVEIETTSGGLETITVEAGSTILETALDQGIELPHDCKMGVCMTCPAKLISGDVDQSAGMLDDTAKEKGYALMCVAEPQSDCRIKVIEEDEILEEVLCSSENAG